MTFPEPSREVTRVWFMHRSYTYHEEHPEPFPKKVGHEMEYMITGSALVALLIAVAMLGIVRDCDVEITFHPPVFVRIKVTRPQRPATRHSRDRTAIRSPSAKKPIAAAPERKNDSAS